MKQAIRIGIIGTGMFGRHHIASCQRHPELSVVHVANRGAASRQEAVTQYGIPRASADAMDLINDPEVDAVIIATPPFNHVEYGIACLKAGKHLLLEKPMASNLPDAQRLLDCAAQHPELVVLEASCRHTRLQGKFRFIKDLIDRGTIGTVYHIHQQYLGRGGFYEWNPAGASWCFDRTLAGGGPVIDLGEYELGFHLGLLNDQPQLLDLQSQAVNGLRNYPGQTVSIEQHAMAWMQFSQGLSYYLERGGPVHMGATEETRIYGSRGGLKFAWQTWTPWTVERFYDGPDGKGLSESLQIPQPNGQNDDDELMAHFADCLHGRAKPAMPLELAFRYFSLSMQIISEIRTV